MVRSIRHTTMNADAGKLNYTRYTKEYTWYSKDEKGNPIQNPVTTVGQGTNGDKLADNNAINVDGKVIAGIENKVNIKIDGKVMFDNSATGDGIVRTPTITSSSEEYKNRIKYGTMEYANKLFKRYEEVSKLCAENGGTLVGLNYEAEKQRLIDEMEKYGLYDKKTGKLARSLPIDYIELPDMVSSGGNVYLNIDNGKKVTGNGLIQAKGAPEIKVENNSNLYMIVNDLSILEPGGEIFLKDLALGNNAKSTLAVKEAKTDASKNSLIDIRENWEGAFTVNYTDPSTKKKEIVNYTPLSNLEINGHIENDFGQVNFFNAYKDIIMQGKTAKDSASIKAATISISAPKCSIAQGYTEGITNIGFTPELVLKQYSIDRENEFANVNYDTGEKGIEKGHNLTLDQLTEYENKYKTAGKNVNESSSGVWLAGGSVFLNGDDININGTIQSGYSQFIANLDNCDSTINSIKNTYSSKGSPEVTDAYLKEYCKLNQSGMLWDETTGTYKYVVQAYYNPQTDKVILEDVNSQGGKIYLTGRISNTGNGKIFAADGASDINITNKTGKDLVANILDVGEREGLIRIMDLGKNTDEKGNKILATLTEMTSKDTKVWYVTSKGQSENPDKVSSGASSEYKPQDGLTYNWSTGYQSVNLYTYMTSYDFT
ncbi:MAG: hypothetical protein IKP71_01175, partial [Candidatus Riflebacteria bacterium]|nr:hypothetical protein [Candidatus Riflebacteria bacterium]